MNKVILIGNLGSDPESRQTKSGKSVCNFSLATNERSGGEDKTEWHKITAWEKTAELCSQYLVKGKKVAIEGSIRTRSWENNEGETKYTTEIHAHRVEFLSPASEQQQGGYQQQQQQGYQQPQQGYQQSPGYGQQQPQGGYGQPAPQRPVYGGSATPDPGYAPPAGTAPNDDDIPF